MRLDDPAQPLTASVPVCPKAMPEIDQIGQTQHPSAEPWQGGMQAPSPASKDRIQSVVRTRETSGDRWGDGVCITADVNRLTNGVL